MSTIKDKLIRHQILLQRLAENQYESMIPFIDKALQHAVRRLGGKRYLSPTEARNLEHELLSILNGLTEVTMGNLDDFSIYESEFIARILGGSVPDATRVRNAMRLRRVGVGLDTGQSAQSLPVMIKRFNSHKAKEIASAVRKLALQRVDLKEAEKQILGMGKLIRSQARSLSVTITNHTATIAKDVTYLANRDLIDKVQWVSVLDQGTTDFCRHHHGNIYPINDGPRPPAHFNCRSVMIPVLR